LETAGHIMKRVAGKTGSKKTNETVYAILTG